MSEKKVLVATIIVIGAVIVLGLGAVWHMQFNVLANHEKSNASKKAEWNDLTKKQKDLTTIKGSIDAEREKVKGFTQRVPYKVGPGFDHLFVHLWSLEKKCGVRVPRIDLAAKGPEKKTTKGGKTSGASAASTLEPIVKEYKIPSVTGAFYDIGKFIFELENEPLVVIVKEFTIKAGRSKTSSSKTVMATGIPLKEMSLIVQSYMFEPPKETKTSAKPTPTPRTPPTPPPPSKNP